MTTAARQTIKSAESDGFVPMLTDDTLAERRVKSIAAFIRDNATGRKFSSEWFYTHKRGC